MTFTETESYAIYSCETPKNIQLNGKFIVDHKLFEDNVFINPTYEELFECANEIVKQTKCSPHIYFEGVRLKKKREDGVMIISITLGQ